MNPELLEKVASFNKLALEEIRFLQTKVAEYEKQAAAQVQQQDKLEEAVKKAADSLYESDFISDRTTYREYIKKAMEDPKQLAKTIEKICSYKDVSNIGEASSVTSKVGSVDENPDPIYNRCFGSFSNSPSLLED